MLLNYMLCLIVHVHLHEHVHEHVHDEMNGLAR